MVHSTNVLNLVRNLHFGIITISLVMAPLNLMLSSSMLTNWFWDLRGYTSVTRVHLRTQIWAMVTPESMAGVSEKMVSVATGSNFLGM